MAEDGGGWRRMGSSDLRPGGPIPEAANAFLNESNEKNKTPPNSHGIVADAALCDPRRGKPRAAIPKASEGS